MPEIITNPLNEKQMSRLWIAIEWSRKKMEPFRQERVDAIKQALGSHYGDGGADERVPVNLTEMGLDIYEQQLASQAPMGLVTTKILRLKPEAANIQLGHRHLIEEIKYSVTQRRVVGDALYRMGIAKVGLDVGGTVAINGVKHEVGQPYADSVDLGDFVMDMSANTWEQCQFIGNYYWLDYEQVMDSDLYKGATRDKLKPTERQGTYEDGDETTESLSQGDEGTPDSYRDQIRLLDLWLPIEGVILTLVADGQESKKAIRVVEWDGPETGPYHLLSFSDVPLNLMPSAPVDHWMDLHELANKLFLKAERQALRQKNVTGYRRTTEAAADAQRFKEAQDGDLFAMDDPTNVNTIKSGGADASTLAAFSMAKDLFVYMGGNLDALGGLSPQSGTLGQDELLSRSASVRIQRMQARVAEFTKGVFRDLAWYLMTDPLIDLPLVKRIPGSDIEIPVSISVEDREGDYLDYNFDIEPYSAQAHSPGERMQVVKEALQMVAPFMQQFQQQGHQLDIEGLLKILARYRDMSELEELFIFRGGGEESEQPVGERPRQAPVTTRENVRINRPGGTRAGGDQALTRLLLGQNMQTSEADAAFRQTG